MAYSYTLFTGNGSTTQYAVAFGYIRREHVAVTVAGSSATFTWVNNSLIQMDVAPANAAAVLVYRQTPLSAPLVDFTDGATLVAADLDTNARQSIYAQQELDDSLVDGLANVIPNGDKGDITTSVGGSVWTIDSGAVTEAKLGAGAVTSAKLADNTIVNADVNASAGIVATKLAFTQAGTGATVRTVDSKLKEVVSVKDFGAVGDGVTDDYTAFFRAINSNASANAISVYIPEGFTYKISKTLYFTRPTELFSAGDMEDPGAVLNFSGATIEGNATFKAAIWVVHSSSLSGANTLTLPAGQVGTYGAGSCLSGISIENSSEHGVILNAPASIYNSRAKSNTKHGFVIAANTTGLSGNANHCCITHCKATANSKSGFYIEGSDANTFVISACMSSNNQYGFNDASLLGGVIVGCEADSNSLAAYNQRGAVSDNSGLGIAPARTVFLGCYSEGDQPRNYSLNPRSVIFGATGALPEAGVNYMGGYLDGFISTNNFTLADTDDIGSNESGGNFTKIKQGEVRLGWNGKSDKLIIDRSLDYVQYTLNAAFGPAFLVRITSDFNNTIKRGRMYMDKGFALSTAHAQTTGTAVPTAGTWDRGNVVWNDAPSASGFIGWVCVTAGTPGTWKTFGAISA